MPNIVLRREKEIQEIMESLLALERRYLPTPENDLVTEESNKENEIQTNEETEESSTEESSDSDIQDD